MCWCIIFYITYCHHYDLIGTPYFVRLVLIDSDEIVQVIGPETVFDTAPVNCTPKERSCIIS